MADVNLIREAEIEYCRQNLEYFIDTYGHIEDRESNDIVTPFQMWDAQRDAVKTFRDNRWIIVLKARQLGISWLILHYILWVILSPKRSAIGLSENEDKAKELIRRMDHVILANMPELILHKSKVRKGYKGAWYESTTLSITIHWSDGESRFDCYPSSENAGRSLNADIVFFDEHAFQQWDRKIWDAAFPTINRKNSGQFISNSTIKRGSLFEELFTTEDNGFTKVFLPWYSDPSRDDEWYTKTKLALADPSSMTAEYPATVEEALTVPGGAYFPEVTEYSVIANEPLKQNTVTYFVMDYGLDMFAGYWIQRDAFGNAQAIQEVYEDNVTVGAAAQIIKDLSEGYKIEQYLAPPDLFNRNSQTGKSTASLFLEYDITLTKVNNDRLAGCLAMKEYLSHGDGKSKFTILNNSAPNLFRCLRKIQHDDKHPNVYAKQPHELTHSVDALRYFCVYWTTGAENPLNRKKIKWREDMYEDYENADETTRKRIIELWGEPN